MRYIMGFLFWLKNIVLWLDQGLNTLLMGDPDETLSRRAGRARAKGEAWGCYLCKILDKIDTRHCAKSIEGDDRDEGRNSVPQMLARWSLGLPATWTPKSEAVDFTQLRPEGEPLVGEVYSDEQINKLINKTASYIKTTTPKGKK